ncbi:hypothetical protein FBQ97_15745, partial [Acidobacteria bacterium ACD]|nr:hypothetical protein [Acidobacteria bacterium ACD]
MNRLAAPVRARVRARALAGALVALSTPGLLAAEGLVSHRLSVTLDPGANRLSVVDEVTVPAAPGGAAEFLLNAALS